MGALKLVFVILFYFFVRFLFGSALETLQGLIKAVKSLSLAEHTSDHGKQTNSAQLKHKAKGEQG